MYIKPYFKSSNVGYDVWMIVIDVAACVVCLVGKVLDFTFIEAENKAKSIQKWDKQIKKQTEMCENSKLMIYRACWLFKDHNLGSTKELLVTNHLIPTIMKMHTAGGEGEGGEWEKAHGGEI